MSFWGLILFGVDEAEGDSWFRIWRSVCSIDKNS